MSKTELGRSGEVQATNGRATSTGTQRMDESQKDGWFRVPKYLSRTSPGSVSAEGIGT